MYKMILY